MKQKIVVQSTIEIEYNPENPLWKRYVSSTCMGEPMQDEERERRALETIATISVRTGNAMRFSGRFKSTMTPLECIFDE